MTRAATAIALLALGGCATVIAGGPDQIPVNTNPPGAYVYVDGQVVGQTPMVVTLDRKRSLGDIRIYYPGFEPVQITRYKGINGWVFGNFFLGLWPVIIDFITGDWQDFDETPIAIGLRPGQSPPPYGMQPQMPQQQPYPQQPQQPQQAPPQSPYPAPAPYPQ